MGCCTSTEEELVRNCTTENTPMWGISGPRVARVTDIYDGDTMTVAIVPQRGMPAYRFALRVDGVDTPELKPSRKEKDRDKIKAAAVRARDATVAFCPVGSIVDLECRTGEKWKRVLAQVNRRNAPPGGEKNLTEHLVKGGFGTRYDGGKKSAPILEDGKAEAKNIEGGD